MNDSFGEILHNFFRDRIPLVVSSILIILFCMPLNFFELSGLRPQVGLICVYYWIEKRPNIFNSGSAFLLGLLMDICSTTPLGINCVMLTLFSLALGQIYRYIRPASFTVDWLFFALAIVLYMFLKWLIFGAYFGELLDITTVLPNVFSTLMFYPLIAYVNNFIMLRFLTQEKINE